MDGGSSTTAAPTVVVGGGSSGTPVACRWNPTKEQVKMLENLYGQGLRTPTAEQIQEITTRLQTYGHIEGKNVFYWFQNHKARQRQKEKQDHLSLFRQYHHRHQPFLHLPPSPNVVYEPCYMPQNNLGLYAHQPQPLSHSTRNSNSSVVRRRATKPRPPDGAVGFAVIHQPESVAGVGGGHNTMMNTEGNEMMNIVNDKKYSGSSSSGQETLNLFPVHPTGILQEGVVLNPNPTDNATCLGSSGCTSSFSGGAVDRLYFDFFS